MSRCAAAELSPQKIRVNAICPGLIATSIFGDALGLPRAVADQMAARGLKPEFGLGEDQEEVEAED